MLRWRQWWTLWQMTLTDGCHVTRWDDVCALMLFKTKKQADDLILCLCLVLLCLDTQGGAAFSERGGVQWRYRVSFLTQGKQNKAKPPGTSCLQLRWQSTTLDAVSLRLRQVPARSGWGGEPQQRPRSRLSSVHVHVSAAAAVHPATGPLARPALFTLSGTDASAWTFTTSNPRAFTFCAASAGVYRRTRGQEGHINDGEQTILLDNTVLLSNHVIYQVVINKLSYYVSLSKCLCVFMKCVYAVVDLSKNLDQEQPWVCYIMFDYRYLICCRWSKLLLYGNSVSVFSAPNVGWSYCCFFFGIRV